MEKLQRGLIVSCQSAEGECLHGLGLNKYFALCAVKGGAVGVRSSYEDVQPIKELVGNIPIIGLVKQKYSGSDVYITPTLQEIKLLIDSKCDVIALDATNRLRPKESLEELVCYCKEHSEAELMADIATISEAKRAETLGFNYIGCTLRSYTEETAGIEIPDYDFIQELISTISNSKVIVEGGIWEKSQLKVILKMNPYAVVIGSSITRPM
ncbi:MAG: N-acetylmannosamine-6-phosphate 2-epimerase, partial [Clostridia bacterium]